MPYRSWNRLCSYSVSVVFVFQLLQCSVLVFCLGALFIMLIVLSFTIFRSLSTSKGTMVL